MGSSTLSYFYPTLVEGLGYSGRLAQYMTVPIYLGAFVCTAITGYFMDRLSRVRGYVLGAWMTLAMACAIIVCVVYDFHARYALLVIMASPMPNEVRAISLAIVNSTGNLAQIYGAYLFPSRDAPKYLVGFGVISGMCLTGVVSYIVLQILLKRYSPR